VRVVNHFHTKAKAKNTEFELRVKTPGEEARSRRGSRVVIFSRLAAPARGARTESDRLPSLCHHD